MAQKKKNTHKKSSYPYAMKKKDSNPLNKRFAKIVIILLILAMGIGPLVALLVHFF